MTTTDTAYIEAVAFREGLKGKSVDELIAIRHEIKERAHEAPGRF